MSQNGPLRRSSGFPAQLLGTAASFTLAALYPSRLPVYFVDVDDRQAGAFSQNLRQPALARSGLANDHDPVHRAPSLAAMGGKLTLVVA
jgi:hypothetical protein